jgi:hypothetical protein
MGEIICSMCKTKSSVVFLTSLLSPLPIPDIWDTSHPSFIFSCLTPKFAWSHWFLTSYCLFPYFNPLQSCNYGMFHHTFVVLWKTTNLKHIFHRSPNWAPYVHFPFNDALSHVLTLVFLVTININIKNVDLQRVLIAFSSLIFHFSSLSHNLSRLQSNH